MANRSFNQPTYFTRIKEYAKFATSFILVNINCHETGDARNMATKILVITCIVLGMLLPNVGTATADTPPMGTVDYDQCKKWKQEYTDAENQLANPLLTCRYIGGTTSQACRDKLSSLTNQYELSLRNWRNGNCIWWDNHPPTTNADIFGFEWYLSVMSMDIYTLGISFPGLDTPISWP